MKIDLFFSLFLFVIIGLVLGLYLIKLSLNGRTKYARIEKDGSSLLLGKGIKEMAYWSLQPVAKFLIKLGFTSNMVSFSSLFLGIIACAFIAAGHFGIAAFVTGVSSIFDALDGLVARLTNSVSKAGAVLDSSIDRYVEFSFLFGLAIYYSKNIYLLSITLMALLGSFMVSYSTAKAEAMSVTPPRGSMRRSERAVYLTLGAALTPFCIAYYDAIEATNRFITPISIALVLVAVFANFSAVKRLQKVAQAV